MLYCVGWMDDHTKSRVLFLCTGNSARSQIAEALLRHFFGDRFEALSAGVAPRGLHPLAIEVMREWGIDISAQRSKDVSEFLDQPVDIVVTLCSSARESCPVFPARVRTLHWDLDDPAAVEGTPAERRAAFRRTRDELTGRIRETFGTPER
jgi:arsenate reductase